MFQVVIHPQAKQDISRNAIWWADHHSLDQALAWMDAVEYQLQELSQNPERFGAAAEDSFFPYTIRQMLVGPGSRRSYRAIFAVRDNAVHVLTVQRADQDELRPEQFPKSL